MGQAHFDYLLTVAEFREIRDLIDAQIKAWLAELSEARQPIS